MDIKPPDSPKIVLSHEQLMQAIAGLKTLPTHPQQPHYYINMEYNEPQLMKEPIKKVFTIIVATPTMFTKDGQPTLGYLLNTDNIVLAV